MPTHAEQKVLPYTPDQMFDLVAGVEQYPDFLPWCLAVRITHREEDAFYADLIIGEKFGSKVMLDHDNKIIRVEYLSGPMRYLSNKWEFSQTEDGQCLVDFYVDFEFKSKMLQNLMEVFFNEIVKRMVGAFEGRANSLYGKTSKT